MYIEQQMDVDLKILGYNPQYSFVNGILTLLFVYPLVYEYIIDTLDSVYEMMSNKYDDISSLSDHLVRKFHMLFDKVDYNGKTKVIAFLLPHQESNQPLYKFVTSVDHVEALTGIDFFPELDDEVENKIEALSDYEIWSLKD